MWLSIAEVLGYDQFMDVWRLLSANPALRDQYDQIKLSLRPIRAWERYQRNRYIASLVAAGIKASEVHATLRRELGEDLTPRQVNRIAFDMRARQRPPQAGAASGIDEKWPRSHQSPLQWPPAPKVWP